MKRVRCVLNYMYRVYIYLIGSRFLFVRGGGGGPKEILKFGRGGGGCPRLYFHCICKITFYMYELVHCIAVRANVHSDFAPNLDISYSSSAESSNL